MGTLLNSPTMDLSLSARFLYEFLRGLPPARLESIRICELASGAKMHRNTIRRSLHCLEANHLIEVARNGSQGALCIEFKGCNHG